MYHPTRTRRLWSNQCLDAVACEGSRLIHTTWMLCLKILNVNWMLIGLARDAMGHCITPLDKIIWVYALNTSIWGHGMFSVIRQQQLVMSPHAAYHPRASSCFFSSRSQHFHCSASQLQRRQHTHSDSSGCNRSRQEEKCCANSTSYSHHSTKQYNKRHVAMEAQVKTLEAQ